MQAVQHESSQSIIIGGKWVLCSKKMMVRYATRLAAFKHPNVTGGYSVGTVNEQPYALSPAFEFASTAQSQPPCEHSDGADMQQIHGGPVTHTLII